MPTLVIQMGHCFRNSGATGTEGEQPYAHQVGMRAVELLNGRGGWTVRAILADSGSEAGDLFAAIHCDGANSSSAHGASVGYRTPEGQQFGQAWKRAYEARGWTQGFRGDNYTPALQGYYGVRDAVAAGNRRAIIIECGFLTSPEDRKLLHGPGGVDRVVRALADAAGIPAAPPPQEEDMLARDIISIAMWEGSESRTTWAVTPWGHWHLQDPQTAKDFAYQYNLPRNANGDPVVKVVSRTSWFGPNLTELMKGTNSNQNLSAQVLNNQAELAGNLSELRELVEQLIASHQEAPSE